MTDSNSPRRNFLCVRSILWTISWYNPHHFFFRPYIMSVKRPLHNGINFSPETFSIKVFFYWRLNLQVFDPFQIPSGWLISISKRSKKVPKMLMIKKVKEKRNWLPLNWWLSHWPSFHDFSKAFLKEFSVAHKQFKASQKWSRNSST